MRGSKIKSGIAKVRIDDITKLTWREMWNAHKVITVDDTAFRWQMIMASVRVQCFGYSFARFVK